MGQETAERLSGTEGLLAGTLFADLHSFLTLTVCFFEKLSVLPLRLINQLLGIRLAEELVTSSISTRSLSGGSPSLNSRRAIINSHPYRHHPVSVRRRRIVVPIH